MVQAPAILHSEPSTGAVAIEGHFVPKHAHSFGVALGIFEGYRGDPTDQFGQWD